MPKTLELPENITNGCLFFSEPQLLFLLKHKSAYLLICLQSYCTDKTTLTGARRPTDAQLTEVSGSASGSDFSPPSTASEDLESLTPGTSSCTHPTSCLLMLVNISEYIHSFTSDKIHYHKL